jgi:hypothetical protein
MPTALGEITEETLAEIAKALTNGVTSSTGIFGVDLSDLVSLVPVNSPFRDSLPRKLAEQGAKNASWRALLNVNTSQPRPTAAFDAAAPIVKLTEQDVFAPYAPYGAGYTVTEDSIALARGYADAKAIAIANALNQWKISEDKLAIGACNFALARPAAPTLAQTDAGGSIAASTTVYVAVAARTGSGFFWGGNSRANSANVATSSVAAATHTVTASVAAVRGAFAYDWFQSADGATWHYYTTTTVNKVTMTSVITVDQAVPSMPDLSTAVPTVNTAADNGSGQATEFNGLMAGLAGDYGTASIVTPGTGTASGATFQSLDGAALTLSGGSIAELDAFCLSLYNSARVSPDVFMLSSQEAVNISQKVLGSTSATTFLTVDDETGRANATAGGYVGSYVNRAVAGKIVKLESHPHLPPGTIMAVTKRVPYPNSNITNTLEMRLQRDAYEYVYGSDRASGGPREDGEVRAIATLVNRAPTTMGAIQCIANG